MEPTFSPKRVAEAVGVSESSLKRWADNGRLTVERTVGGHRRIHRSEVLRFVREAGLRVRRPDLLGLSSPAVPTDGSGRVVDAPDPADTLFDQLSDGDAQGTHAFLLNLYLEGMPIAEICDGPVKEAMHRIGEVWHCERERGIVIEHRATAALLQAIASLRAVVTPAPAPGGGPGDAGASPGPREGKPVVLGGSPTGDPYLLPSILTAWVLADAGCDDVNLGPETPPEAFVHAVEDHKPLVAWIACACGGARPANEDLKRILRALQPHGGSLVIGGRGFVDAPPPPLPGMSFCRSMAEVRGFVDELLAAPVPG